MITANIAKGLGIAGALLLSACTQRQTSDRIYHDTYYVVAHTDVLLSLLAVAILFALAWLAITRLSHRFTRKHAALAATTLAIGGLFSLAPLLTFVFADPAQTDFKTFALANRLAVAGSAILLVTLAATAVILLATLISRLRRR